MLKVILGLLLLVSSLPASAAEQASADPGYVSLGEPLVLNLTTEGTRLSFVQLKAEVLIKDESDADLVEMHIPALRHQLILMLSEQNAADMKTATKREQLRQKISAKMRSVFKQLTGKDDIEEVLFSSFLVQ
jgi:flagellar protein FliL